MTVQPANRDFARTNASRSAMGQGMTWHYPASTNAPVTVRLETNGRLALSHDAGEFLASARLEQRPDGVRLADVNLDPARPDATRLLAALIDAVFIHLPDLDRILLPTAKNLASVTALATELAREPDSEQEMAVVERAIFRQLPLLWREQKSHVAYPCLRSAIGPEDRLPPLRPQKPSGVMYRRWVPGIGLNVSLRPIDRRTDLGLFHRWMNQGRVAHFWELAKSEAELDAYLAELETDPHIFGVIASFDSEPVGYFEFYWAKEDRLGPYYEPEDFDRGWHGLVGNSRHLGRPKTRTLFCSVTHYLFLDEPRTHRIVGEPRASHQKMLSYTAEMAYDKVKEFDFPHKRAALVCCERDRFFREVAL
ncbi:GNAT family N-acetyltransferase [Chelativorans sp. YIM 93263]|uniref:GNAT family N-acetyltransferase n=1 Tax=Chelativorans sp. YIM 93263 TaxID=2906648 RepID=UPI002379CEBA|nr:GNAT family N-acetyltransferase [Chelativorans sp. YIM 93263]